LKIILSLKYLKVKAALLVLLILSSATNQGAGAEVDELAGLKAEAEALFAQRQDLDRAAEAADCFRRVLALDPTDQSAAVRLLRVLIWLGVQSDGPKEQAYYQEAVETARTALIHHPDHPGLHYWLGAAYGLLTNNAGPWRAMSLVEPIKKEMTKVLELDPGYEYGGADRVLGRLFTKLPSFLGGDKTKAEDHLRKAVGLGPRYWLNHLYLADLLIGQKRIQEARDLLQEVMSSEPLPDYRPESAEWREAAQKLLASTPADARAVK